MKQFIKDRILHPLFKASNYATFFLLVVSAIILFVFEYNTLGSLVLGLAALFIIFNKLENLEQRVRDLEGD